MTDRVTMSGHWRASVCEDGQWRDVRPEQGPYLSAGLVEWGSITKGLVGTAAALSLPLDERVCDLTPRFPKAAFTVRDLVDHTSGLPRLPVGMTLVPGRDPYRSTVGLPLKARAIVPVTGRGTFAYSNLGYAVLGELLDEFDGAWFDSVRRHVFQSAGITTATTTPEGHARVMARRFGRVVTPWTMAGSPYAAAGGIWSTFADICRYAEWALSAPSDPTRTIAWQHQAGAVWINGQVRAASAAIVFAGGATAVVHGLAQRLLAVDHAATTIVRQAVGRVSGAAEHP